MNYISVITVLFFTLALAWAGHGQDLTKKDLKRFYKNQESGYPLQIYQDAASGIRQIFLIRHGEPDLGKKGWRNRTEAIRFMQDYDSATVIPFPSSPLRLEHMSVDTIYHSPLPRARHTAQLAFGKSLILVDDNNYREFERKTLKWCNIKMPTKFWTAGSRILWLMGMNDKYIETFRDAKKRAKKNATGLTTRSETESIVIVVAHGLHNKYVKKYLRKADWKLVYDNGNGYLSLKVMALFDRPQLLNNKLGHPELQ